MYIIIISFQAKSKDVVGKFLNDAFNYRNGKGWMIMLHFIRIRAQNNGRSTENDRPKMLVDRSHFYLTGHFDRPHFYHLSKKHKLQETQKNTRDGNVLPN